ncbi:MAG: formylglycine-generating enzyme family protein [Chloroflexi bacterium]|nr:MAG: formylglycine-generating enzyme family protein [Chloroflexota bacterium]
MLRLQRVLVACLAMFLAIACGDVVDQVGEPTPTRSAAPAGGAAPVARATLTPTIIQIRPTDTPPPPPPTPTPRPTNTPVPVEETIQVEATETPAPTITNVMVEIPAGPFTLGNNNSDPNEAPEQQMDLPAFMIDAFEVTNADFAVFVEATGYKTYREQQGSPQNWRAAYTEGKDNHPVVFVTFYDAQAFCKWAGKRLPTEFEWEKAARGPEGFLFPWGNQYDPTMLNGKDSGLRHTTAVGSYPPNGYGLFDMAGNVKEWVDSPYVAYPGSTFQDPHYSPDYRGIRGGGWFDEEKFVLATNRNGGDPSITANDDIGFRCAK